MIQSTNNINLVLIGHVDAGKSTIGGRIISKLIDVDSKLKELKKLANENKRESWMYSYLLDSTEEEQKSGKTKEFAIESIELNDVGKILNIIDSPGHENYICSAIQAMELANVCALLVSVRKGEYTAGIIGGQTIEHISIANGLGIKVLYILLNKIDTLEDKNEIEQIKIDMTKMLKAIEYKGKTKMIEISGLMDIGINEFIENLKQEEIELENKQTGIITNIIKEKGINSIIAKINGTKLNPKIFIEKQEIAIADNTSISDSNIKSYNLKDLSNAQIGTIISNTPYEIKDRFNITIEINKMLIRKQEPFIMANGFIFDLHIHLQIIKAEMVEFDGIKIIDNKLFKTDNTIKIRAKIKTNIKIYAENNNRALMRKNNKTLGIIIINE